MTVTLLLAAGCVKFALVVVKAFDAGGAVAPVAPVAPVASGGCPGRARGSGRTGGSCCAGCPGGALEAAGCDAGAVATVSPGAALPG